MKGLIAVMAVAIVSSAFAAPVKITFTNTGRQPGILKVAVFKDARFFPDHKEGVIKKASVPVTNAQTTAETTIDLPAGNYAISVILDENNNDNLDTNIVGIPKERFGFSGNPTIRFGAPSFGECDVTVPEAGAQLSINLKKFL